MLSTRCLMMRRPAASFSGIMCLPCRPCIRMMGDRPLRGLPVLATTTLALGALLSGCAGNPVPLRVQPVTASHTVAVCDPPAACNDTIDVRFLGVGGFTFAERGRGPAVATAPMFTRPSLWRAGPPFVTMRPDSQRIAQGIAGTGFESVRAILVGHGHYDHLLDVPVIARAYATDARILGSSTVYNLLMGDSALRAGQRMDSVTAYVGSASKRGEWISVDGGRWRVMPLASSHAPNFGPFYYERGTQSTPRTTLPRTGRGWKMGPTYAWLIDYLGDDTLPRFRIFYQDAASTPEYNVLPPLLPHDERRVDLAIICVGNWNNAPGYPDTLLAAMQPRHVIAGHWDDFFRYPSGSAKVVPSTKVAPLATLLDRRQGDANWSALEPRGLLRLAFTNGAR